MSKSKLSYKPKFFSEGSTYQNRRGEYVVLSVGWEDMEVQYKDGEKVTLNQKIQEHIIQNTEFYRRIDAQIREETSHPAETTRRPKAQHLKAWNKKVEKVKTLEEMSLEELEMELSKVKKMRGGKK